MNRQYRGQRLDNGKKQRKERIWLFLKGLVIGIVLGTLAQIIWHIAF